MNGFARQIASSHDLKKTAHDAVSTGCASRRIVRQSSYGIDTRQPASERKNKPSLCGKRARLDGTASAQRLLTLLNHSCKTPNTNSHRGLQLSAHPTFGARCKSPKVQFCETSRILERIAGFRSSIDRLLHFGACSQSAPKVKSRKLPNRRELRSTQF
jgi:hypothetical protein